MKVIILSILLIMFSIPTVLGQIKIGDNPQNIDPSSVLELESNSKVLVITRVSTAQMDAIIPQRGGMVYNTDTECIYYYDGSTWINLCDAVSFSITNDPIINGRSTIEITQSAQGYNLEVAQNSIRGENIADGGIGAEDIRDNSINQDKLAAGSVGPSELSQNAVKTEAIEDGSILPEDIADQDPYHVLTTDENGIVQWEDANEIYELSFSKLDNTLRMGRSTTPGGGNTAVNLDALVGSDNQQLSINAAGTQISLQRGGTITLPAAVAEADGIVGNEILNGTDGTLIRYGNGTTASPYTLDVSAGGIKNNELAVDAVESDNIRNGTILTEDIANDNITPAKIQNGTSGQVLTTDGNLNVVWATLKNNGNNTTVPQSLRDSVLFTRTLGQDFIFMGDATGNATKVDIATVPLSDLGDAQKDISMGNFTITDLHAPSNDADAATKKYVDDKAQTGVPQSLRDSVLFTRTLGQDFIFMGDASGNATKVDIATVPLSDLGDAQKDISMGNFTITDLHAPSNDADAATKKYVDDKTQAGVPQSLRDSVLFTRTLGQDFIFMGDATGNATKVDIATVPLSDLGDAQKDISMGNFTITDLHAPSNDADAATKKYVDDKVSLKGTTGSIFFADNIDGSVTENNNQLFWNSTDQVLGIGTNNPDNTSTIKLHVVGSTRSGGFISSDGGPNLPSYRFNSDPNTGMFWGGAADQLAFSVGGNEAVRIKEEGTTDSEIVINGSLELTEQLLDEKGNTGNAGDVLTATSTGTEWKSPQIIAMGKANGANSIHTNGIQSISGGSGSNTVNFTSPRPDADYIIQLTVEGDNRIYITSQTTNGFTVEIRNNDFDNLVVANWYFTISDF
ncbi:hypothetical protein ACNR9Q_16695 [Maribacter sp. X9]|uniref:hypothetical protein n=1 Tax=Maribacter sp. X9 TaxID=3402159 RepID=UPI003AF4072F